MRPGRRRTAPRPAACAAARRARRHRPPHQAAQAVDAGLVSTRARPAAIACSTVGCAGTRRPAAGATASRRPARWSSGGCAGRVGAVVVQARGLLQLLEHGDEALRREAGLVITPKPMRSASRSMSREKFSCCCSASAWLPAITAAPACGFLLAAMAPRIMAATISGRCCFSCSIRREMWRCVTWLSSCASTEASSSRLAVTLTRPRCRPSQPPGTRRR
jgi:hypothetical protein